MAPTTPLRYEILTRIADRLRAIQKPAYHATFLPDAVSIDARVSLLTEPVAKPFALVTAVPDGGERRYLGANQIRDVLAYEVQMVDDADPLSGTDGIARAEALAADVEAAMVADISLGGLVVDVKCQPPQVFVGVGSGVVLVVLPLLVTTHRTYGEPYV